MPPYIKCRKCGLYKDKSEYYENKKNVDGVCGMCIECMKIYKPDYHPKEKIISIKLEIPKKIEEELSEKIKQEKPEEVKLEKSKEIKQGVFYNNKYRCYKCGEYKDISEFHKNRSKRYGIKNLCKECTRKYNKIRPYRQKRNSEYMKNYHLQYKFGIGIDDYNKLYDEQNGCCNICKLPFETMDIDHDHKTGEIRGLLCRGCNTALGLFHDNIESLRKAILYLNQ